jgi:2-phosphosulfolactate phosphatase
MDFLKVPLSRCGDAGGVVVVIDVLRAFTTAAYAFAGGAAEIWLVSTVEEAFELRKRLPGALLMGEVDGLPIKGFDYSNSPYAMHRAVVKGRQLIQRTSAGVQGVVRSTGAEVLLAASFCNARATAEYVRLMAPARVTFVVTGAENAGGGDEDEACADYLTALLSQERVQVEPFLQRVRASTAGRTFADPAQPEFPEMDLEYSVQANRFDFVMKVGRVAGGLVMRANPGSW